MNFYLEGERKGSFIVDDKVFLTSLGPLHMGLIISYRNHIYMDNHTTTPKTFILLVSRCVLDRMSPGTMATTQH